MSLLALPGPQKGLLCAHCTDGSPGPVPLAFPFLCVWPASGMAGSPDHLTLRGTGVSLGQVGRTSLSDPRPREAHPPCYFWLFQVGPGLLPPQRAPAARTWWPAGSHMMSSIFLAQVWGEGGKGGESTPHSGPHPFLRRPVGAGGNPKACPPPSVPRATRHYPVPGFSGHFSVPPLQWMAVKIALGLS